MRSIFAASIILALSAIHAESTPAYFPEELKKTIDRETERLKAPPNLWQVFLAATGYEVGLGDGIAALFNVVEAAYPNETSLPLFAHKHGVSYDPLNPARALSKLIDVHPDKGVRALLEPFKNVRRRSDAIQRTVNQELPFPHNAVVAAGRTASHPFTVPIVIGLAILGGIIFNGWSQMISAFIRMQHNLRTPARLKEPE